MWYMMIIMFGLLDANTSIEPEVKKGVTVYQQYQDPKLPDNRTACSLVMQYHKSCLEKSNIADNERQFHIYCLEYLNQYNDRILFACAQDVSAIAYKLENKLILFLREPNKRRLFSIKAEGDNNYFHSYALLNNNKHRPFSYNLVAVDKHNALRSWIIFISVSANEDIAAIIPGTVTALRCIDECITAVFYRDSQFINRAGIAFSDPIRRAMIFIPMTATDVTHISWGYGRNGYEFKVYSTHGKPQHYIQSYNENGDVFLQPFEPECILM